METKQITAVDWFYQRILSKDIEEVFRQAKELEKTQIIEANMSARLEVSNSILQKKIICEKSEQYYYNTFK